MSTKDPKEPKKVTLVQQSEKDAPNISDCCRGGDKSNDDCCGSGGNEGSSNDDCCGGSSGDCCG